jgi:polysaccharide export outer membrane protein
MSNGQKKIFMKITFHKYRYLFPMLLTWLISSCVDTRKATYFNGVNDGNINVSIPLPESFIRKNDILSISVTSPSPDEAAIRIFNTPNTSAMTTIGGVASGYLVSSTDGAIQFPLLGAIKAEGLTKDQLREKITKALVSRELLKDAIVTIRFLNFRVTVLGEVNHPAVVTVPNEKISLLEAIGLAGDVTIYGKRDNVLIIREENGQRILKRINLNSNELLTSPYYYLKSEDVVYVEPNKTRVATSGRSQQWIPIVFGALSLAVIVIDRVAAQ